MNTMIEWLARTTVATSVVLLLLLVCRHLLARRLGAHAIYLLWLAVPIGLLLAPLASSSSPASLPALLPPLDIGQIAAPGPLTSRGLELSMLLGLAWLAGCVAMLVQLAFRLREAGCLAAKARAQTDDGTETGRTATDPRMRVCDEVASPVVVGLLRPLVLLPPDFQTRLEADTRALVLRHEAVHARRRDNLANLFAGVLLAVLWFNPLAWIGMRAFRTDQELSCDAHALAGAGPPSRIGYARSLVTLASASALPTLSSPWHAGQSMKRRIDMLDTHRNSRARLLAGMALLALLVASALLVAPTTRAGTDHAADASEPGGEVIPIVRVSPSYPRAAVENKVEGFVTAEFTITENGSVADIVVVDAEPADVFNQVATDALAEWRFKPWIKDGAALPFRATQTIEFTMD